MVEDAEDYRSRFDREHARRLQLEKEVKDKESLLAEEHDKLLEVERGLLKEHEAVETIEEEHIRVLRHQLKSEHNSRVMAEKERDDFKKTSEVYKKRLSVCEVTSVELEGAVGGLEDEVKAKDSVISNLSKQGSGLVGGIQQTQPWEKPKEVRDIEDLKKLLDVWGNMKLKELCMQLVVEEAEMLKYARQLEKEGLVKLLHTETKNPTLTSTKKLVSVMSNARIKSRRRGR